ncbi:aldo/keto reductase [Novipirellula artificiosorum]|uniref:Aldo/keto reductase family protein n=1 Tax=Novipirellula artificiosorum TaxID=2528016 RepID=A0A5C6D8E1_9BACT|nr:aldo/keto reductase [Novipirellula artificiosorum]TWU32041.1 Aldo/keto reductase family protein [Novipirellula artificiosorum]
MDRRTFLQSAAAGAAMAGTTAAQSPDQPQAGPAPGERQATNEPVTKVEWRNKQAGMAYRRLGRTGLMVSEIVSGGDPIRPDNYEHLNLAIEKGLNYLDMAPAYGRGKCEEAYGKLLTGSAKREKVFLTTKISGFKELRNRLYQEIFDELPAEKQKRIMQRAEQTLQAGGAAKPGYFVKYWPGQDREFAPSYLSNAMMPDYAHRVEGSKEFAEHITNSIEESLKRVGTDYFDIVMCPHGACTPEELRLPEIQATIDRLKQQGKIRFLGVTSHNDPAAILRTATEVGYYDLVMMAYNVINGGYLDHAIQMAAAEDVGVIGMKVAMAVATHHKSLQPIPQWRIDKVDRIVPGEMKAPMKAYLWALQNPSVSAVISNLWDKQFIEENLSLAGKKVELQPA